MEKGIVRQAHFRPATLGLGALLLVLCAVVLVLANRPASAETMAPPAALVGELTNAAVPEGLTQADWDSMLNTIATDQQVPLGPNGAGALSYTQVAKTGAADGTAGDGLGLWAVAVSGDTAVVGANNDAAAGDGAGSAYIFERNQGGLDAWGQVTKLTASDAAAGHAFGTSVAIHNDTVVVGATGNNAAYIFARNQGGVGAWGEVTKITGSDTVSGNQFGTSVGISDDTVVVTAPAAFVGATPLAGAGYVFERNQGGADAWGEVAKIVSDDVGSGNIFFGIAVDISGDTILAGAPFYLSVGAGYLFERNEGGADAWGQAATLSAADGASLDGFGRAVAIDGSTAVIGAWQDDDAGDNTGGAYVFERNQDGADAWGQVMKLVADDAAGGDYFGLSVSISIDTVAVGAYDVPGGAVYLFERNQGGAEAWGQIDKLIGNDTIAGDAFSHVGISGDTVVVGAPGDDDAGDGSGSVYVFGSTGNSWAQTAKTGAADGAADDLLGVWAVALSGDTAVVGAQYDDDAGDGSGSAYIFERNQGGLDAWGQVAKLTASDAAAGHAFGTSVAIYNDTVVIGADGNEAAYIFERNQGGVGAWGEVAKITGSDTVSGDDFGERVGISEDTVVVTAPFAMVAGVSSAGAGYVFERNQGGADAWGEVTKIVSEDVAAGNAFFGVGLAISGDTILVGAIFYAGNGPITGAGYIFERNQGGADAWGQVAKLSAADGVGLDGFGRAVALDGSTAVIGAWQDDDAGNNTGGAYIFERNQNGADAWGQVTKLVADDAAAGDYFGLSVSISTDIVAVGSYDVPGGAVYLFERNQNGADAWGQIDKLIADDTVADDTFSHVSVSGDTLLVGVPNDDDAGNDSGSAYIFTLEYVDPFHYIYIPVVLKP